jgi:N-methylhydantoinase A
LAASAWTVAIDVGGTFTDAIAVAETGERIAVKVPSLPDNPADGLLNAIDQLVAHGVPPADVQVVLHGTTVATNAVITGRIARVTLVTTEGFRDILRYRSGSRPDVYDLRQDRPDELVLREDRIEARERQSASGDPVVVLTEQEVDRVIDQLKERDPQSIAICLLFSYVDDRHEKMLEERIKSTFPDVPVTRSSKVAREFREYPRSATTVVNAGLRPIVGSYVVNARDRVASRGMSGRLLVMQSNGGCVPAERAEEESHRLLLSGPAAGVAGAVALGARCGLERLISLDMGGTSVDVSLVSDGVPPMVPMQHIGPHPIISAAVDIFTAGAGGGSIVELDPAGRLQVGPRSAGADPGPVAYGRGGKEPTLTDAHAVAGSLGAETALGGNLTLDVDAARQSLQSIADRLGLPVEQTAEGVIAIATSHLEGAIRRVSTERGVDPREFTLVAFGGAGPLHAGQLVRDMGFPAAVIPDEPGLFSASGLLAADLRIDDAATVLFALEQEARIDLEAWFSRAGDDLLARLRADGIAAKSIRLMGSVDCRYVGQGYELSVPIPNPHDVDPNQVRERFHQLHLAMYGHSSIVDAVEAVTLRLSAFGRWATRTLSGGPQIASAPINQHSQLTSRPVRFRGTSAWLETPVLARQDLEASSILEGPVIVEQFDTTILILPGQTGTVDEIGNIWIREAGVDES